MDKEGAARTWKKGFGYHPLLGFVDHGGPETGDGEPVGGAAAAGQRGLEHRRRPHHGARAALAQIPAALRVPDADGRVEVWSRTDAAGATKEFAAHLGEQGVEFSVGASFAHLDMATALALLRCRRSATSPRPPPRRAGHPPPDVQKRHRESGQALMQQANRLRTSGGLFVGSEGWGQPARA